MSFPVIIIFLVLCLWFVICLPLLRLYYLESKLDKSYDMMILCAYIISYVCCAFYLAVLLCW